MTKTFSAIFENGVLRPLEPVDFPERCRVRVEVREVQPAADDASHDKVHTNTSGDNGSVFSAVPRPIGARFELDEILREQRHKRGIAAIMGQWPGNESDDEVAAALKELS